MDKSKAIGYLNIFIGLMVGLILLVAFSEIFNIAIDMLNILVVTITIFVISFLIVTFRGKSEGGKTEGTKKEITKTIVFFAIIISISGFIVAVAQ